MALRIALFLLSFRFSLDFMLAFAGIVSIRLLVRGAQTLARSRGINLIPTLVVGRGPEAALCIKEMRERPALGYRVIGVVENNQMKGSGPDSFEGVPVVGDLKGLPEAIRDAGANEVIIADPGVDGDALFDVMMRCGRRRGVEFRIAPNLFNCLPRKTEIDQIGVADDPLVSRTAFEFCTTAETYIRYPDCNGRITLCGTALAADCPADQARLERPGLLCPGAGRHGWPHVSLLQVSNDATRRR